MTQTITQEGQLSLSMSEIADLFETEFDGWCPVCTDQRISDGQTICCECFKRALAYHSNTCECFHKEDS